MHKKLISSIIIILILSMLCGCSHLSASTESQNITINLPTDESVNGYRSVQSSTTSSTNSDNKTSCTYCANKKTKKFHKSDCPYAKKTSSENCFYTDNRQELIDSGYTPCKHCNP